MYVLQPNIIAMGQFNKMLFYFGLKNPKKTMEETPNAWGHQVYNNHFRKMQKDHQMDLNNHTYQRGFIEKFTNTYVKGVHLKNRMNEYNTVSRYF